ncbi:hypothetical protein ACM614_15385, partial [Streptomyces sp. 12297]
MTAAVLSEGRTVADDLSIWPTSTTRLPHGGLAVGGVSLAELAERFDTPAYVLDEGEVRGRCRTYRDAEQAHHDLRSSRPDRDVKKPGRDPFFRLGVVVVLEQTHGALPEEPRVAGEAPGAGRQSG